MTEAANPSSRRWCSRAARPEAQAPPARLTHTDFQHVLSKRTLLWFKGQWPGRKPPSAEQRAQDLIAAIDAGGLPLNPARVNDIARHLGLEVSVRAPMEQTIARIRTALGRSAQQ